MKWTEWFFIGVALLLMTVSGLYVLVAGLKNISLGNWSGLVELGLGSVLMFFAVYFFIILADLKR